MLQRPGELKSRSASDQGPKTLSIFNPATQAGPSRSRFAHLTVRIIAPTPSYPHIQAIAATLTGSPNTDHPNTRIQTVIKQCQELINLFLDPIVDDANPFVDTDGAETLIPHIKSLEWLQRNLGVLLNFCTQHSDKHLETVIATLSDFNRALSLDKDILAKQLTRIMLTSDEEIPNKAEVQRVADDLLGLIDKLMLTLSPLVPKISPAHLPTTISGAGPS